MMVFVARMLFIYTFLFWLIYFGILFYKKSKVKSELVNNLLGSIILTGIFLIVYFFATITDLAGIPDGRFLITGYAAFFISPVAASIIALWSSFLIFYTRGASLTALILVQAVNITLYSGAYIYINKQKRKPNNYEVFASILMINTGIDLGAFVLFDGQIDISLNINRLIMSILIETTMFYALYQIYYREQKRMDIINNFGYYDDELKQQNEKIASLYREVSSNQEELKKNFDELSRYEERIEYLAFHELQTGFLNHEKLMEQLRGHKSNQAGVYKAMLIIGINDVERLEKTIGIVLMDTLHYLVGIEILAVFDELSDGQVFSLGKGKYAILINNESRKENLKDLYQQLQMRFLESFIINTIELKVTIAAGAIELIEEVTDPEQWIEQCEFALYNAVAEDSKDKRIIWFGKELMELHTRELRIEKELYKALENNDLYLVYQAQFDNDKTLIGAEALLRWYHKELGDIPPGIFIPIAVKNGLVDSIGKLAIRNACNFVDRNREILQNFTIPIAVNASFLELINPFYTQRLLELLRMYNIPCECIRVEVTESEVSLHYNQLLENLKQLNRAGIGVELDDFGTGYSSLNHLGSMPVHTIKIDKVFVDNILGDKKIGDLVEMIIDFAHRFRMRVVAEGVETEEQFIWLKNKNCDVYQGFYFAKPMKEDVFLTLVNDNRNIMYVK